MWNNINLLPNLALKCDLLFLFQKKGPFNQLVGRSYSTQDINLMAKLKSGQEMQPWVSTKMFLKEWKGLNGIR